MLTVGSLLEEYWAREIIWGQDLSYYCLACLPPLRLSRNKGLLVPIRYSMLKQVTEWRGPESMKIAAEILLLNLTVLMVGSD